MVQPKPITITAGDNPSPGQDPQPFIVVGGLPAASPAIAGGVTQAAAVANATVSDDATSAATQLNALLAALRDAGIIASS